MKIYVASSWRNFLQQGVVAILRKGGHEVYDFRNPKPDDHGFHWSAIDPDWKTWTPDKFRVGLCHEIAERGFMNDFEAMEHAEACVLVLPCGRSAHLEAGWFIGRNQPTYILMLEPCEPELMYKMVSRVITSMNELFDVFQIPN